MVCNLERKNLIASVYEKRYNEFLNKAISMTKDIDEAKDAVQDGFYRLLIAHVDGPIVNIEAVAMQYIKWSIFTKYQNRDMAAKHIESYSVYTRHLLSYNQTPNIEYYPFLQQSLKNVIRLSKKEKFVVSDYIMGECTRQELFEKYKIKINSLGSHIKRIAVKLRRSDPVDHGPQKRGNEIEPETLTIIEYREKLGMPFKKISEVLQLPLSSVKNRYYYHADKN